MNESSHADWYEEDEDWDSDDWDADDEESDEWVLDCGDPECCMNFTYHFRSECYTPEMYEAAIAEAESEECTCHFGEGAQFHLPECPLRTGNR